MSATKRQSAAKSTGARKAPTKRRVTAEEREIAELSARIDRRLHELHAQADELLRGMRRRSGA